MCSNYVSIELHAAPELEETPLQRSTLIVFTVAVSCLVALAAGCSQAPSDAAARGGNVSPLPDLNTVEECQRADLGRYWGSTFRFHLYDCWADVTFSESGEVLAFEADDVAACERVLGACRP